MNPFKVVTKARHSAIAIVIDLALIALIAIFLVTMGNKEPSPWVKVDHAQEEFNGTHLSKQWAVYNSPGNEGHGFRRPSAISVHDGELRIKGVGEVSGGMAHQFSQVYGKWEIVARQERGAGYGPAILLWPDSENWPIDGEIDIAEIPGGERKSVISSVHYGADNKKYANGVAGDFTQWHTYGVEWTADRVVFFLDGKKTYEVTDPLAIPKTPMHLAIQNDVGRCGSFIGCFDSKTPHSVSLYVKSVKVWAPKATTLG